MDPARIAEAANLLVATRRTGVPLRELPDACKPRNVAETNAIIDAVTAALAEPTCGWKFTFLYAPLQPPFMCRLFTSRVFGSPARVPRSLAPSLFIEAEISFRLTADLPPRNARYRPDEVAAAVVACPSLELVDTRFDTAYRSLWERCSDPPSRLEVFADHATHGAYVAGEGRADWQDFDFAAMRVVMKTQHRTIIETVGGHAFLDPFLPCVVFANLMRRREGLRAGELLVTGSFTNYFEVKPDDVVTAEFEGFGSAQASFAPG